MSFAPQTSLGNLGNRYAELGEARKAIEYYEQALVLDREIDDRRGESTDLENMGHAFTSLEEYQAAEEAYEQGIQIADGISYLQAQHYTRWGLAHAYLFQNDLINAHAIIEVTIQYDVPENNHNATALHGIIALRQAERETAQEAFMKAIAQADEILSRTPEYYSALDAKGLALCGSALCTEDGGRRTEDLAMAVETFRKARKIAPHAGIVKSVLRLFDELVKCDSEGILKDVREAVEGKE